MLIANHNITKFKKHRSKTVCAILDTDTLMQSSLALYDYKLQHEMYTKLYWV